MKSKYIFLSAIISVGVLSFTGNDLSAVDDRYPSGGQKCYPGNRGCPNRIQSVDNDDEGRDYNDQRRSGRQSYGSQGNNQVPPAKKLKMQSAEKFKGTVENVSRERHPDGRLFIQIDLDTDEGMKTVIVGPASYIDQSKVKLQVGDKVTVTGFRVTANGEEVIVAKEIDKSGNILKLLDDKRQPLWPERSNGSNGNNGNGYRYQYNANGNNGNGHGYQYNGNGNNGNGNNGNGHQYNGQYSY